MTETIKLGKNLNMNFRKHNLIIIRMLSLLFNWKILIVVKDFGYSF